MNIKVLQLFKCSYSGETLRTLRFGQRLKSIKNQPIINEIKEDEVNDLSDQIRQLKVLSSTCTSSSILGIDL